MATHSPSQKASIKGKKTLTRARALQVSSSSVAVIEKSAPSLAVKVNNPPLFLSSAQATYGGVSKLEIDGESKSRVVFELHKFGGSYCGDSGVYASRGTKNASEPANLNLPNGKQAHHEAETNLSSISELQSTNLILGAGDGCTPTQLDNVAKRRAN